MGIHVSVAILAQALSVLQDTVFSKQRSSSHPYPAAMAAMTPAKRAKTTATTPTSSEKALAGSAYNKWAMNIPFPKETGDDNEDSKMRGITWQLREIVHKCMQDPSHTVDLSGRLRERELNIMMQSNSITGDLEFQGVKRIDGLPAEWIRAWVATRGGLQVTQVRLIDGKDPEGSKKMMSLELQLAMTFPLPVEAASKEVTTRWFNQRGDQYGKRLQNFVRDGGIAADGTLDWAKGCFRPLWAEDRSLQGLQHITDVTIRYIDADIKQPGSKVVKNWLDGVAEFKKEPFPGLTMLTWWPAATKSGPHAQPVVLKKTKGIEETVTKIANDLVEERNKAQASSSMRVAEQEAAEHISEDRATASGIRSTKAREAAAKAACAKKRMNEATL